MAWLYLRALDEASRRAKELTVAHAALWGPGCLHFEVLPTAESGQVAAGIELSCTAATSSGYMTSGMAFPADESCVRAAEEALGCSFPAAYRRRLLADNGGEVFDAADPEDGFFILHPVFDGSDRKCIGRTADHVVKETAAWREWAGFPPEAIATGDDQEGNDLLFLPGDDHLSDVVVRVRTCSNRSKTPMITP